MKRFLPILLFFSFLKPWVASGQNVKLDKTQFFHDTTVLDATISMDLTRFNKIKDGDQIPANFSATFSNGFLVNEPILLELRGHFRKDFCYLPPLRVIFKSKKTSVMKPLGTLKLVSQCKLSGADEQYLLKEFLVYKIYNLLTEMSFRVRLLNLHLVDSFNKKKPLVEHAFLIEDVKALAERNNCIDRKDVKLNTEATDRKQMTIVALFEYMIGNTDWAVPINHNTRLIVSKTDTVQRPYVIPYDFDYSGFVNTYYAIPDENLGIANVRERNYRGFSRTMPELNEVIEIFKKQKDNIFALINNFELLTSNNKKDLHQYLEQFFNLINNPKDVNNIFIEGARTR